MGLEDFTTRAPGQLLPIRVSQVDPLSRLPIYHDCQAFLPDPLPDQLDLGTAMSQQIETAAQAVGRLNGLGSQLSNPYLLIRPFLRREAVASSRIEGTIADLQQLVLFEEAEETADPGSDVSEVMNYVRALEYGLQRPADRMITTVLIREMHAILMRDVRGGDRRPGHFREGQVYIGDSGAGIANARFIPPPATEIPGLMLDLERAIASDSVLPKLVRTALIHYQFETIHPFEDGNGRIGRVLIQLLLQDWRLLDRPLLYLSGFFERNREAYLDGLLKVSQKGAWSEWIAFFLEGVRTQAIDAVDRGQKLLSLREDYRRRYQSRPPAKALETIDLLFETPTLTVRGLAGDLAIGYSSAQNVVIALERDEVLTEVTGRKRDRVYLASEILAILN